jgi:UDP-glucose 4-epimerase
MKNLRQGMVSIYLEQALKNKHIIVKGSPDRYRDFVYIDDVVNAFLAALAKPQISYNVYNVATGVRTTVEELIAVVQKKLPFEVSIEYSGSTPGDQFGIYGNCSKSKKELNWYSEVNLDIGIEKMVDWVLK